MKNILLAFVFSSLFASPVSTGADLAPALVQSPALDVRVIADEAEAVLALLAKKNSGLSIGEADWQRVFSSEGYVRLKKRETGMGRPFEDEKFRAFVLSDDLAGRAASLRETLNKWKRADASQSARLALAYLPKGARIRAKIYPVIKPQENSFVFELGTDPAIFLYLNPEVRKEQFENTLAHELHHVGYHASCSRQFTESSNLPPNVKPIADWAGTFGEGVAMLAAAGGPDIHPHLASNAEDRNRWDEDVGNFNDELKKVEKFFLDVFEKRLTKEDEIRQTAFSFFGVQGPWYTVGWKMAVMIEKTFGREKLIAILCDPKQLLVAYNEAALEHNRKTKEPLALWAKQIIEAITAGKPPAR